MSETPVDKLRRRLRFVVERTEGVKGNGRLSFRDDGAASHRQVRDESRRGLLALGTAKSHAVAGLAACDEGDLDLAETLAWSALEAYARGLEQQVQRVRRADREVLATPAKPRGRPQGSKTGAKKADPAEKNK